MTSGNLSEEPIAHRDEDALARLGGIADLFLVHDREIEARADDSVARVVAGASAGHAPGPRLRALPGGGVAPASPPGAGLRGAPQERLLPGLGRRGGRSAPTSEIWRTSRPCAPSRSRWRGSSASSGFGRRSSPTTSTPTTSPPATRWIAPAARASRPWPSSTTTPTPRRPWRSTRSKGRSWRSPGTAPGSGPTGRPGAASCCWPASTASSGWPPSGPCRSPGATARCGSPGGSRWWPLDQAFDGQAPLDSLPVFDAVPAPDREVIRRMVAAGLNSPPAHGAGRLFDAVGAIALGRGGVPVRGAGGHRARRRGGRAGPTGAYPFTVDTSTVALAARLAAHRAGRRRGRAPRDPARRRLDALPPRPWPRRAPRWSGWPPTGTGGCPWWRPAACFQNARLAELLVGEFAGRFEVYLPGQVPPGDGGIALGQAVVASATAAP